MDGFTCLSIKKSIKVSNYSELIPEIKDNSYLRYNIGDDTLIYKNDNKPESFIQISGDLIVKQIDHYLTMNNNK